MTIESIENEARIRADQLEEKQILGVYDNEISASYDDGWNSGEVSGFEDGFIDGAKWVLEKLEKEKLELKWYKLDWDKDFPKAGQLLRVRTYGGMEYICKTDYYEPAEDEIGYGEVIIQFYDLKGDWVDDNEIEYWCELPVFKEEYNDRRIETN